MQNNNLRTSTFDDDHFHDECGVFGIFRHRDAAAMVALGLHALHQHRTDHAPPTDQPYPSHKKSFKIKYLY